MHEIGNAFLGTIPVTIGVLFVWLQNNQRFNHVDKELGEIKSLTNHFIDISMDHGERIATLEERTGGKPKKP